MQRDSRASNFDEEYYKRHQRDLSMLLCPSQTIHTVAADWRIREFINNYPNRLKASAVIHPTKRNNKRSRVPTVILGVVFFRFEGASIIL
jgi:hypothetical protein